jgi:hypothetical protein
MKEPRDVLVERQQRLPELIAETPLALHELYQALALSYSIDPEDPGRSLAEVERTLPRLRVASMSQEDRLWLITRMMHFIAALARQRWGGTWRVETNPKGRFFQRYVLGGFKNTPVTVVLDPAAAAAAVVDGERLADVLAEAAADIERAGETAAGPATDEQGA